MVRHDYYFDCAAAISRAATFATTEHPTLTAPDADRHATQVQKRRIYDITNVLEGVGYIERHSKNHIRRQEEGPAHLAVLRKQHLSDLQDLKVSWAGNPPHCCGAGGGGYL